jgi:hypothetical protein
MKKLILFAAVAGLGLVSASPPGEKPSEGPREARSGYPPCSRTVTDRCIQRSARHVRERGHASTSHRTAPPAAATARAARFVHHQSRQVAQRIRRAGERG